MNAERLTKLAEHLKTVKPETFSMSFWNCGYTACAGGHACDIPEFKELGLTLVLERDDMSQIHYDGYSGFSAIEKFFDLNEQQSHYLFGSFKTRTNLDESQIILNFVKDPTNVEEV